MNRIAGTMLGLLAMRAIWAAPANVRLSGTVFKTGGAPLPDVSISLRSAPSIATTSLADGTFLLKSASTAVVPRQPAVAWEVVQGSLRISPTPEETIRSVETVSADGRTKPTQASLDGGGAVVPWTSLAQGRNLLRVSTNIRTFDRSALLLGRNLVLSPEATPSWTGPASSRAAATTDTLVFRRIGFQDKSLALTSYLDSNLSVGMDTLASCPAPKAGSSKSNPLFTDVYTADPAVMVDRCTFYIQCGHDQGTGGFDLREWYLLKSTDMVTWTRTTPMSLKTFAWTNANAWAGQMIKAKNGKYYWYVPINDIKFSSDRMAIGVAVADSPEGPWKDALGKPLIRDSLEMATWNITNIDQTPHTIDPTVFIDDDGQAYLQYGGFWRMVTVKLNPDMVSISGKLVETTPPDYFESPYLIKRNGTYYEIYAHGSANPTTIDYATSKSPMGPWTHRGTILGQMPKVAGQDETTNHAGVAEFAGQWYIVYHVSDGPNGGGTYRREVAIDKLTFNADGTIQPVIPSKALTF